MGSKSRSRSLHGDDETDFTSSLNEADQGLVGMITRALRGDAWDEEDSIEEYTGDDDDEEDETSTESSIRETLPVSTPSRLFRMRGDDSDDYTDEDTASDLRSALDDFLDSSCAWSCCSPVKPKGQSTCF